MSKSAIKPQSKKLQSKWKEYQKDKKGKNKTTTTTTKPATTTPGYAHNQFRKWCDHEEHFVQIGDSDFGVYASSVRHGFRDPQHGKVPDFGLYADWTWKVEWRNEHICWPDYSAPSNLIVAFEQILCAYERAEQGEHVEIGCIGGHGRTGTVLACMQVLSGMKAWDAISHIKDKYCVDAVEGGQQEWYVEWFEAQITGEKVREMPGNGLWGGYSVTKANTSTAKKPAAKPNQHTMVDHFYPFLASEEHCPKKDCPTWDDHTKRMDKQYHSGKNFSKECMAGLTLDEHAERILAGKPHPTLDTIKVRLVPPVKIKPEDHRVNWWYDPEDDVLKPTTGMDLPGLTPNLAQKLIEAEINGEYVTITMAGDYAAMPMSRASEVGAWVYFPWKGIFSPAKDKIVIPMNTKIDTTGK